MVLEICPLLPHEEASEILNEYSLEARICGIIPEIGNIPIVEDYWHVITDDEARLIRTGTGDLRLRATFDLMQDPLRYALKYGYSIDLSGRKQSEYLRNQIPWMITARDLLRMREGREPESYEVSEHFIGSGGSLFYHLRHMLLHPADVEKNEEFIHVPDGADLYNSLYTSRPVGMPTAA